MLENRFKIKDVIRVINEIPGSDFGYGIVGEIGTIRNVERNIDDDKLWYTVDIPNFRVYGVPDESLALMDENLPDNLNRTKLSNKAKTYFRSMGLTTATAIQKRLSKDEDAFKDFDHQAISDAINNTFMRESLFPAKLNWGKV